MKLQLKRIGGDYAVVHVHLDNTVVDLGTFDEEQAKTLLNDLKTAVEEVEWFLNAIS